MCPVERTWRYGWIETEGNAPNASEDSEVAGQGKASRIRRAPIGDLPLSTGSAMRLCRSARAAVGGMWPNLGEQQKQCVRAGVAKGEERIHVAG